MQQNNTSPATDPTQGDPTSSPPAQGANPPSQGGQGTPSIEALRDKIAELERDNRKYRAERKQQEEAAQLAEQQRLQEQGEFKKLAEQHATRVKELEPLAQGYTALSQLVASQIDAQIKDWPAELKAFDPGPEAPIEQRLAWIEKSKPIIAKLTQHAQGQRPGNSPNPPAINATPETTKNKFMDQLRKSGKYGA